MVKFFYFFFIIIDKDTEESQKLGTEDIKTDNSAEKTVIEKIEEDDELEIIKNLILDNLDEFCISFTDKIVFHEKNEIFNKYINKLKNEAMIKLFFDNEGHTKNIVNDYFSKDIMDFFIIENLADKENTKKKFMDENQKKNKLLLNFQTKNNAVFENISCLLFLELISTEIDIDNVISNFRYKDPLSNESKFDLYNLLEKLEDDNLTVCESCNFEKMKNFVSFVNESIFLKWNTELQKRTFNEYFYNN